MIRSLPYQSVWFGQAELEGAPRELVDSVKPEFRGKQHISLSNHSIPPKLEALLAETTALLSAGSLADAWSPGKVDELLRLQQQAVDFFHTSKQIRSWRAKGA